MYHRRIYPSPISIIIRVIGPDNMIGSAGAFLSKVKIIRERLQAADFIAFSGTIFFSSVSDRQGTSHVWRRSSASSGKLRNPNDSGQ